MSVVRTTAGPAVAGAASRSRITERARPPGLGALGHGNGDLKAQAGAFSDWALRRDLSAVPVEPVGGRLAPATRSLFESALGTDLRAVRVQVGARAAGDARRRHAFGYTVRDEVTLGAHPVDSRERLGVIARELMHVAQQRDDRAGGILAAPRGALQRQSMPASGQAPVEAVLQRPGVPPFGPSPGDAMLDGLITAFGRHVEHGVLQAWVAGLSDPANENRLLAGLVAGS